jgi:hypothetical protein
MIGIQFPETANYFDAPHGHFFRLPLSNLQGAKLGNVTDIPYVLPAWTQVRSVSRSGSFAPRI